MTQEEIDNAVAALTAPGAKYYPFWPRHWGQAMAEVGEAGEVYLAGLFETADQDTSNIASKSQNEYVRDYWEQIVRTRIAKYGIENA
jgi:hypothetical protein